jgi:hypothetical protein
MTDSQRQVLDVGLRLIENPQLQPSAISPEMRSLIAELYPVNSETGRRIVIDAIARTGYFTEAS